VHVRKLLIAGKQAGLLALSGDFEEKRDFLHEHGSNLFLKDHKLDVSWQNGLEIVAGQEDLVALSTRATGAPQKNPLGSQLVNAGREGFAA